MAMLWKDAYSVGVAEIDRQHKKLIDMINKLHQAMSQGKGKQVVEPVLADLVNYCATHFKAEEKLMADAGYPELDSHREKHQKMTQKVLALQADVKAGKATITMEVMRFLEQWLDKHILGTDKKYGPHLNAKGIR